MTVKMDSETRWSARSEAVYEGLDELVGLLKNYQKMQL